MALNHVSFQAAMLAGPAVAGLVAAAWGVAACYLVNVATSGVALYAVARLPAIPPTDAAAAPASHLRAIVEGWRFVARRPVLRGSLLTDLAATVLAMPIALFPMVNEERFGGDPRTLSPDVGNYRGGLLASLTSSTFSVVSGGLLCMLVVAVVAARNRPLRRFRTTTDSERR